MAFSLKKQAAPEPEPEVEPTEEIRGKGRPTPKRRDIVGARGPVTAPRTRKEAYARQKANAKAVRTVQKSASGSTATTPAQRRAALRSGEILAKRDQGESRGLARDYVDSRRMISNWLLVLFPIMIASYFVKTPAVQIGIMALFLVVVGEWIIVGRRLHRLAVERFGSADTGAMSLGFYAGSRAYLPRRWRMPAPRVELGDQI